MPFDGPLLATSVVSALAAVPGAIRDLKELLGKPKLDPKELDAKLRVVVDRLAEFCRIEKWLEEAKEIHDMLQRLDVPLEQVRTEFVKAMPGDKFSSSDYDVQAVNGVWRGIRMNPLAELLAKAQLLERIEEQPLKLDASGKLFVSGPQWAERMVTLGNQIDEAFKAYEGDKIRPRELADLLNLFIQQVKSLMFLANMRIKGEAQKLGDALKRLGGNLEAL